MVIFFQSGIEYPDGKDVTETMCAIAGIIGLDIPLERIDTMLETMHRRGPDGKGVYREKDTLLLHSRLAIIDPKGGRQPMALSRGRELYVLIYNGELYNTEGIREELLQLGHSFEGHSDTEVVLHAYVQWGRECVHRFNGIFAFAVWEEHNRRLFLARDRIGVKPLFFTSGKDWLIFASEMKTIFASGRISPALEKEGALQLLMLGPGRVPGSGVFRNVRELKPGYWAEYQEGTLRTYRYWKLTDREHRDSFEETVESVRYLVTDAIRAQMVSDVPIGTFLSGGLDSSIITAVCAEEKRKRGEVLDTFSVDYRNNDRNFRPGKFQPDADADYIRLMQDSCRTRHHDTVLSSEDLVRVLEDATVARDLPGMADVDFSLLAFCKEIRKDVKVALSGECADEIFGGYPWYRDPEVRALQGFPWAQNTMERCALLSDDLTRSGSPADLVMDACEQTCRESDILPGIPPRERRMKEMMNLNFHWFMQTLLDRKDRMSMYTGLEVRVPFCDYRIAEYLYGVPWEFKDYLGREKGLLRKAVEGLLPDAVLKRKKSPYPKTMDPGYEALVRERLETVMADKQAPIHCLIKKERLQSYLAGDRPWPWYGQLMGRAQTMAYFLQLDFWLRHYGVELNFS